MMRAIGWRRSPLPSEHEAMATYLDEPRWFDEVAIGDTWRSQARTITETDVVNFATMTGDFNPLHVNHKYARTTPFGRPIAHGLLGLSLVAGLGSNSPSMQTTAFMRVVEWKFLHPIYIGDTVYVLTEVVDKQSGGKKNGLVIWRRQLVNDDNNIVVQQGTFETLVKRAHACIFLGANIGAPRQPNLVEISDASMDRWIIAARWW